MPLEIEHLTQLAQAGLLSLASDAPEAEYVFRHTLVQEAAYSTLLRADRRRLHRAVGEVLEATYPDQLSELAPLLAAHFTEAGDDARALHYWTLAGDVALAAYANPEAARAYEAALALAPGDAARAALLIGLGE